MKILLDTHILLWAAYSPTKLSSQLAAIIEDPKTELIFSAASIWEIAIKSSLGRNDFSVNAGFFRRALLNNNYLELPITGQHTAAVQNIPKIHNDPFDRLIFAQASIEGLPFYTADQTLADYGSPVHLVS